MDYTVSWPHTLADEAALRQQYPFLRPATGQPRSLGEEVAKIGRFLDRVPEPFPDHVAARLLATVMEHAESFRIALGGKRGG